VTGKMDLLAGSNHGASAPTRTVNYRSVCAAPHNATCDVTHCLIEGSSHEIVGNLRVWLYDWAVSTV
jgi:hypothetical protein